MITPDNSATQTNEDAILNNSLSVRECGKVSQSARPSASSDGVRRPGLQMLLQNVPGSTASNSER